MDTTIFISAKLAKIIPQLITNVISDEVGVFGHWNADVFFLGRKKCWLLTNAITSYSVVLTKVSVKNIASIQTLFSQAVYDQLNNDGFEIHLDRLVEQIGTLKLHRTNNDKITIGFQTRRIQDLHYWKTMYGDIENMLLLELVGRLNTAPVNLGGSKSYTSPVKEMAQVVVSITS
jgi:hypothetical protein